MTTSYPGGKNGDGVYQTIINQMPPHKIYIEPFLGGGAILRKKRPAPIASIAIDIDAGSIKNFAPDTPIPGLRLIQGNAIAWLGGLDAKPYLTPETLIYLDPPYLMDTRSTKRPLYQYEFCTPKQHHELLQVVKGLPCMIMISGYLSDLYTDELPRWRLVTYQAQTRSGKPATECLWMNYDSPVELHDYRYLGDDYRERERIKRKQKRWKQRLQIMPDLERYALLSVIEDLRSTTAINDVTSSHH